jgi:cell division protein FtsQ
VARAELRSAARERRRAEKAEVRRFTRRARNRRSVLMALSGVVVVLVGLVLVAVYSPILALRTVTIEGTSRIDATQVQAAVSGQLGTPLALIDFTRMTDELSAFPLIRSYVTETVPPGTLIIRIVERQPVAVVQRNGGYELVDPAGVTIALSPERPVGVPFIDLNAGNIDSQGFRSAVEVLLSMPAALIGQVDSITATTQDDVTMVLVSGQRVKWGDADDSAKKARVLVALIAAIADPNRAGTYDVSAPSNAVFSPDPVPPPPPTVEAPPADGETQPEG